MTRWSVLAGGLLAFAFAACLHLRPSLAPPPPPPPIRIPPGCAANLSGTYFHEVNPAYRYFATDDGGVLVLALEREELDGGARPPTDGGVMIVLRRTPQGFVGKARGSGFTSTGHECPVEFATEIDACLDAGLLIRSAATAAINEECQTPAHRAPPAMLEHHLVRDGFSWPVAADAGPDGGGSDAGVVDAGALDAGPVNGRPDSGALDAGRSDAG